MIYYYNLENKCFIELNIYLIYWTQNSWTPEPDSQSLLIESSFSSLDLVVVVEALSVGGVFGCVGVVCPLLSGLFVADSLGWFSVAKKHRCTNKPAEMRLTMTRPAKMKYTTFGRPSILSLTVWFDRGVDVVTFTKGVALVVLFFRFDCLGLLEPALEGFLFLVGFIFDSCTVVPSVLIDAILGAFDRTLGGRDPAGETVELFVSVCAMTITTMTNKATVRKHTTIDVIASSNSLIYRQTHNEINSKSMVTQRENIFYQSVSDSKWVLVSQKFKIILFEWCLATNML